MAITYKGSPGVYSIRNTNVNTSKQIRVDNQYVYVPYNSIVTYTVRNVIELVDISLEEMLIHKVGYIANDNISGSTSVIGNVADH